MSARTSPCTGNDDGFLSDLGFLSDSPIAPGCHPPALPRLRPVLRLGCLLTLRSPGHAPCPLLGCLVRHPAHWVPPPLPLLHPLSAPPPPAPPPPPWPCRPPGTKLFILQQRAPAATGRQRAYAVALASWLARCGVSSLLLLCGLDSQLRRDAQLDPASTAGTADPAGTVRYIACRCSTVEVAACQALAWRCLEPEIMSEARALQPLLPPWPLLTCCASLGPPCLLLACFAAEGDNGPDGLRLAQHTLQYLHGLHTHGLSAGVVLQPPCSWVSMYGRQFPRELMS